MSKIHKILGLLMLAVLLLTSCGGKATQAPATSGVPAATEAPTTTGATEAPAATGSPAATEAPTTAASGEKTTITLATWAGADESKELQAVIDKVNAEATDFQIVHQAIPSDYYTKVQTMIAGNTAPDLMWL